MKKKPLNDLQEGEEHLRFMIEMIPDIAWTALPDGYEDFHNSKFEEFTGLSEEEAKGTGWQKAIHPEDISDTLIQWNEALVKGNPYEMQYRLKSHDGIYKWFFVRAIPWKGRSGNIIKWFGTTTDINDKEILNDSLIRAKEDLTKTNEELSNVNQVLNHFFYITAHDLRAPVNNMKMLLNLLKKEVDVNKKDEVIGFLENSVDRLGLTINALNELVKVGDLSAMNQDILFEDILKEVLADLTLLYPDIEDYIISNFHECPSINYIHPYLTSIIKNLISNSYKYRSKNRTLQIDLRTQKENDFVKLFIKDNGIGFNMETSNDIFKPFIRLTKEGEGKGIGLFVVRYIVEKNGGKAEVDSKEGVGTTFTFLLREYD